MSNVTHRPSRHVNIPIFIPHMGCPHRCVFCDQRAISGHDTFDLASVRAEIDAALATVPSDATAEIAYFGGSFTAIDRASMIRLLDIAQTYVEAGRVSGIRFSTRPDAVEDEVLDVLSDYTVSAVELGLQSMDDTVLHACRRGHTAKQAEQACERLVAKGYSLVGQMMLGLPASNIDKELYTAERICDLGAYAARIYPTVVFDRTPLAQMLRAGTYTPLDTKQAAARAARVMELLEARGVRLLRVGLCASEVMSSSHVLGGANHPAMGELAYSALFYRRMAEQLQGREGLRGRTVTFYVPRGKTSQAVGQHRENVKALMRDYGLGDVAIIEKDEYTSTQVHLAAL